MNLSYDQYRRKNEKIAMMAERAGVAWDNSYLTAKEWGEVGYGMRMDIFAMLDAAATKMAKAKIAQLRSRDVPTGSQEVAW